MHNPSTNSPLRLSQCMHSHGIKNFPDPTAAPGGGTGLSLATSPGSETVIADGIMFSGPAFDAAAKACGKLLPGGGAPPPPPTAQQKQQAIDGQTITATLLALACFGCALALAACGASALPGAATATNASADASSHYSTQLKFSQCMRSHGVPDFPDPTPNATASSGPVRVVLGIVLPPTMNPRAPAFRSALNQCRKLVIGAAPKTVSASTRLKLIQSAECMRKHGVPNFPDPTFPPAAGSSRAWAPASTLSRLRSSTR